MRGALLWLFLASAILFLAHAWWQNDRWSGDRIAKQEHQHEIAIREGRLQVAALALESCNRKSRMQQLELEERHQIIETVDPHYRENHEQEVLELKKQLKDANKSIRMLHRELNPCTDKEWPGKTEPQNSLPGPKRQVKVIAWSPASGGGYRRNSAARAPVPRGMEEYFKRLGVDVSDGLISTEYLGSGTYATICDGLAVRHSNYSEFYDTDIIYMDNPIGGDADDVFSNGMLPPRLPHHFWVMRFAGEPLSYYPGMAHPYFLARFNFTIGYHRGFYHMHAVPYIDLNMTRILRNPLNDPFRPKKNSSAVVAMFVSNCVSRNARTSYLSELMKHIKIHSFGRCMTNKEIPSAIAEKHGAMGGAVGDWQAVKMDVIREYKFLIAFENSDCYDYVTEKVYNGLNAGAIPIYMGAPNIIEFVPDHSIINAADFSSPESLARYINVVNNNDDLYASYWEWRKHPLPERLERMRSFKKRNVCDFVKELNWT